ncbi:hypothetical protein EV122DRAFT_280612 [Schizophyllum commune]
MSSLFLPRDSVPKRNDDGSLATVYVADVDVDAGKVLAIPNPTTTFIMARPVMFHKTYLLEAIEENVADIGPACEILRLRLQLLTERAKAHIQRQSSYASAHAAYVSALNGSHAYGLNILDQREFDDEAKPHAWGVECMTDIMKPINYRIVFAPATATTATTTSETSSAAPVAASLRGTKRAASDEPSASVDSLPKRARLDSDLPGSNDGDLPHVTTNYTTYYSDLSTKDKKRSRSDSDEEDRTSKRVRESSDTTLPPSATVLTPLPLDDDDLSDADAEGEEDEVYTHAITPEVARPVPAVPSTTPESHPVAGCGPRATQGLKTLCLPMACHTALPRQADVDEPLSDAEAVAADDPASDDDDSVSVYEPPSRSPTPVTTRSGRRLRSRNAKPYDRPSTSKPRASTKKSKSNSRASTSRTASSRASSSSSSKPFIPQDAAAAAIGSNCHFPRTIRAAITPVGAPGHVNLGLDNAYHKCPPPACSVCKKQKRNTGDLTRHILSHIVWGDKRVNQCRSCPVSYARTDALTRHLRHNPGHRGQYDALCPEFWVKYKGYSQHVVLDISSDE